MAKTHNPSMKHYGYIANDLCLKQTELGVPYVDLIILSEKRMPAIRNRPIKRKNSVKSLCSAYGGLAIRIFNATKKGDFVRVSCDMTNADWYEGEDKQYQHNKGYNFNIFSFKKDPKGRKGEVESQAKIIARKTKDGIIIIGGEQKNGEGTKEGTVLPPEETGICEEQ